MGYYCIRFIGLRNVDKARGHRFSCVIPGKLDFVRVARQVVGKATGEMIRWKLTTIWTAFYSEI